MKEGFIVITAPNGKQGLEELEHNDVDLIVTDLNMPVMDGYTFLKIIKADVRFEKIPIIIITVLDENVTVIRNLRAGACGYLTKPFSMKQVRSQLDLCLRVSRLAQSEYSSLARSHTALHSGLSGLNRKEILA